MKTVIPVALLALALPLGTLGELAQVHTFLTMNVKVKSLARVSVNLFSGEISWRYHFPPEGSVP